MNDTRNNKKEKIDIERIKSLPIPTKNIFADFLETPQSYKMPTFIKHAKNPKNNREYTFCGEFIAIYQVMFMNMYRNRIKPEYGYQEICHLSNADISKISRFCKTVVKNAIQYGIAVGFFEQIKTKSRVKCMYKVGHFKY